MFTFAEDKYELWTSNGSKKSAAHAQTVCDRLKARGVRAEVRPSTSGKVSVWRDREFEKRKK